jgi:hypothetical protein
VWHFAQKQQIRNKAIKLLQVVLASAPTAKTRVLASNTHNGATHRSKCPARTAARLRLLLAVTSLLVLGSALGAFGQLQGHFMPLQEARRSPHGRRYGAVGGWAAWWAAWWAPW